MEAKTDAGKHPIYNFAVIGAGCIGAAAARHLAASSTSAGEHNTKPTVLVIGAEECRLDDLSPASAAPLTDTRHVFAEHYDEGRITRCTTPDVVWANAARAAVARYEEVESSSGIHFFSPVGCLTVAPTGTENLDACMSIRDEVDRCDVQRLQYDEMKSMFPYLALPDGWEGVWEPTTGGHISPRQQIRAHLELAQRDGAVVVRGVANSTRVMSSQSDDERGGDVVEIGVEDGSTCRARRVLIAAGAYVNSADLLQDHEKLDLRLTTTTTVLGEVDEADAKQLLGMPSLILHESKHDYALPPIQYPDGRWYIKIGHEGSLGYELPTYADVEQWYKAQQADAEIAEYLKRSLQALLPTTHFLSWVTRCCVVSRTSSGYPYIGRVNRCVGVVVGSNGGAAKGADEWGRLAAEMVMCDGEGDHDACAYKILVGGHAGSVDGREGCVVDGDGDDGTECGSDVGADVGGRSGPVAYPRVRGNGIQIEPGLFAPRPRRA